MTLTPHYDLLQHVARAIADSQCKDATMGEKYPNGVPGPYLRLAEAAIKACGIEQLHEARKLLLLSQRALAEVRNNETAMRELRPHEQATEEILATYSDLPADDAFEAYDAANVDNATVAIVLGQAAAQEYAAWIYANLK